MASRGTASRLTKKFEEETPPIEKSELDCLLGKCHTLYNLMTVSNFEVSDVEYGIVFFAETVDVKGESENESKTLYHCFARDQVLQELGEKSPVFVPWIIHDKAGYERLTLSDKSVGHGLRPVREDDFIILDKKKVSIYKQYKKFVVNGSTVYLEVNRFFRAQFFGQNPEIRAKLPMYKMVFDRFDRIGNPAWEFAISGTHAQGSAKNEPIQACFKLELITMAEARRICANYKEAAKVSENSRRNEKINERLEKQRMQKEAEEKLASKKKNEETIARVARKQKQPVLERSNIKEVRASINNDWNEIKGETQDMLIGIMVEEQSDDHFYENEIEPKQTEALDRVSFFIPGFSVAPKDVHNGNVDRFIAAMIEHFDSELKEQTEGSDSTWEDDVQFTLNDITNMRFGVVIQWLYTDGVFFHGFVKGLKNLPDAILDSIPKMDKIRKKMLEVIPALNLMINAFMKYYVDNFGYSDILRAERYFMPEGIVMQMPSDYFSRFYDQFDYGKQFRKRLKLRDAQGPIQSPSAQRDFPKWINNYLGDGKSWDSLSDKNMCALYDYRNRLRSNRLAKILHPLLSKDNRSAEELARDRIAGVGTNWGNGDISFIYEYIYGSHNVSVMEMRYLYSTYWQGLILNLDRNTVPPFMFKTGDVDSEHYGEKAVEAFDIIVRNHEKGWAKEFFNEFRSEFEHIDLETNSLIPMPRDLMDPQWQQYNEHQYKYKKAREQEEEEEE